MKKTLLLLCLLPLWQTRGFAQVIDSDFIAQHTYTSLKKALKNPEEVYGLNLWGQELKKFPIEILKLKNLRILELGANTLSTLPKEIENLYNLEVLGLSRNRLTTLPKEVGNLYNLRVLDLKANQLTTLPKEIGNLQNLEELKLGLNPLEPIIIKKNNKALFTLDKSFYNFTNSKSAVPDILILDYDKSIVFYQPFMNLKHQLGSSKVQFIRPKQYQDYLFEMEHHGVYVDADIIEYDFEKEEYHFYSNTKPVTFTSTNYFNIEEFENLKQNYNFHPLKLLASYIERENLENLQDEYYILPQITDTIALQNLSQKYHITRDTLKPIFEYLSQQSYCQLFKDSIILKPRFYHNINSYNLVQASTKFGKESFNALDSTLYYQNDFDNIRIVAQSSHDSLPVATFRTQNNEIAVQTANRLYLSENAYVEPQGKKKEMLIHYYGLTLYFTEAKAKVGQLEFEAKDFFWLSADNSLEVPEIDKIIFIKENSQNLSKQIIESKISLSASNILLQYKHNKSGLKQGIIPNTQDKYYESYPILNTPNETKIYFQGLDSTKIYASMPSLYVDSLDVNLLNPEVTFHSDIFPDFKTIIRTLPNGNYGFVHTPQTNYPIYTDYLQGVYMDFSGKISMTENGLVAGGKIKYLSTTLDATEFKFTSDSITSKKVDFKIENQKIKDVEFGQARGESAELLWNIPQDNMIVSNKRTLKDLERVKSTMEEAAFDDKYKGLLFSLYESTNNPMILRGYLKIGAKGMKGKGNVVSDDFTILSVSEEPLTFEKNKFSASNTEFRINSEKRDPYQFDDGTYYPENPAILQGNFVDVNFDLSKKETEIKPFPEFADFVALTFPYAQYKTSIKDALWEIDENRITLQAEGDKLISFVAENYDESDYKSKNIQFQGKNAIYDLKKLEMEIQEIPYIYSADAKIIPKDGKVVIENDAYMQDLENATLILDTLNEYHTFFDATIQIISRQEFEGEAMYHFINADKDTFNIKFDNFRLVEDERLAEKYKKRKNVYIPKHTISGGEVKEVDKLFLKKGVQYKGFLGIIANEKAVLLNGFVKFANDTEWYAYEGNSDEISSLTKEILLEIINNEK